MFIESSKDILYLVLAFCALWFTAFVCWVLWYLIRMLRDASSAVREVRDKLHAVEEAMQGIREKLEHSASYLGMVATGTKVLIDYLAKHKEAVAEKAEQVAKKVKKKMKKMKDRLDEMSDDEEEG